MKCNQVAILMLLAMTSGISLSEELEEKQPAPQNRVDFTTVFFDTNDTDSFTGVLSYTRNISPNSNLALDLSYLDSRFGLGGGSGVGDTTITFTYLPNAQMSAEPWVPRIIGSGISVMLPTGNDNKGRGLGSTILLPFVGTQVPLSESITFAPTFAYAHSTDSIVTGQDVRMAALDLGLIWVRHTGLWASAYVGYIKDYESDNTSTGGRLSVGKLFASGWGFSAHFSDLESFRPGLLPGGSREYDQVYTMTALYTF